MDKIYINLTTEGQYTPEFKQSVVYKTLRFMPKILKITSADYAKIFGITKQAVSGYYRKIVATKLTSAYSFASINTQFLQERFKDQKEIDINKICDILYINTDRYSKDKIEDAISILVLLPSYEKYKNVLTKIINEL